VTLTCSFMALNLGLWRSLPAIQETVVGRLPPKLPYF
jgi:hypothetical protein